jgi:cytoskeletal protein CcmA (bactofilin family)
MEQELKDIDISCVSKAIGGKYNKVTISELGGIKGDIECNYLETSGVSNIKGNVKAKIIEIFGPLDIKGNVECEEMRTEGTLHIRGNATAKKIKISGASDIRGNIRAEDVEILGYSDVKLDCEVENFVARGIFKIGGLLNAGNIDIHLEGPCSVREMGGEHIEVRIKEHLGIVSKIISFASVRGCRLVTDTIEGDNIYLEGTIAKIVRGNNITIGAGCEIDLVEYKNELKVVEDGKVKKEIEI